MNVPLLRKVQHLLLRRHETPISGTSSRQMALSEQLYLNIEQSERHGGLYLAHLQPGDVVSFVTQNTSYVLEVRPDGLFLQGNLKYCATPTPVQVNGSTWGGSMIKSGFIGREMHLEFVPLAGSRDGQVITTFPIQNIWLRGHRAATPHATEDVRSDGTAVVVSGDKDSPASTEGGSHAGALK